jgi:hypothetical protein
MFRLTWLVTVLLATGCAPESVDPYQRAGTWTHGTDNDANLRVMIANPRDLVEGAGQGTSIGAEAAPPVTRLLTGKRYPLPAQNASTIGASSAPPQQGAGSPASN